MAETSIAIELTRDQALVFFDWLARFNKRNHHDFEDQAEQRILWDIEADLEKRVTGLFADDYVERLAAARARVRDPVD